MQIVIIFNPGSACNLARGLYKQALVDALRCIELDKQFMKVNHILIIGLLSSSSLIL
jgi:hypothetical protein